MGSIKIKILNNKLCEADAEPDVLQELRRFFSYKAAGVEFSPAVRSGRWDGFVYLFNKQDQFPLGLLSKVKAYSEKIFPEFPVEIEDTREPVLINSEINIAERLKKINKVPRDYQEKILQAAIDNRLGIIRATTGSGKTLCAALITAKLNKPTIVYVIGLDLLNQFHKTFSEIFDEPIGFIGNGVCDIQKINIASVWTLGKALDLKPSEIVLAEDMEKEKYNENHKLQINKLLKETKVHIIDECHMATCDTIRSIHKIIDPEHLYGLSGTPYREDGSDLLINGLLGDQIINVSASELIEKKVLSQPLIKFEDVPIIRGIGKTYPEVYKNFIVENPVRNDLILKGAKDLIEKGYPTLVLFKIIKHGEILFDLFEQNGIKCEILSGQDDLDRREEVKEKIMTRKIDLILASTIYDIGVDIPIISGLILAGGGKSSTKALQRIGRVIRSFPNKNFSAIHDFFDNVKFLRDHSVDRFKIYKSEAGFKVFSSEMMKEYLKKI